MKTENKTYCELCGCECKLTKHHLIPQVRCKNKFKEIKEDPTNHIWICDACHGTIHATLSENELRDIYNTKDALLSEPTIAKFVAWKKKHPNFSGHSKMTNNRKH